jgi:hypothetical protein
MDSQLVGKNHAADRIRAELRETHSKGIEYPKATNERGTMSRNHREYHAAGDQVGGESKAPGNGGAYMKPRFGNPVGGMNDGHFRKNAIRQANPERHAEGDSVGGGAQPNTMKYAMGGEMETDDEGREKHFMGNAIGGGRNIRNNVRMGQMGMPNMPGMNGMRGMHGMPAMRGVRSAPQAFDQNQMSGQPGSQDENMQYRRGGRIHKKYT